MKFLFKKTEKKNVLGPRSHEPVFFTYFTKYMASWISLNLDFCPEYNDIIFLLEGAK